MKTISLIICLIFSTILYSQKQDDVKKAVLLRFLEENILVIENKNSSQKVFNADIISIKVDSIGNYNSNIFFYKFKLGSNEVKVTDDTFKIYFNSSSCNEYIIAYSTETKISYRIKGFNGNDLLFLIKDINQSSINPKKTKKILIELNKLSIGVDFTCIHKALQKLDFNSKCLKACIDGKESH